MSVYEYKDGRLVSIDGEPMVAEWRREPFATPTAYTDGTEGAIRRLARWLRGGEGR